MNTSIAALRPKRLDSKYILGERLRPDLPELTYDTQFATSGKLPLPMGNRTGWGSCIIPSVSDESAFLVAFYETIKIFNPPPEYFARIVRVRGNGSLDPSFGNEEGFIDARLPGEGISIIKGFHETSDGKILIWGTNTNFSQEGLTTSAQFISRRLAKGQSDTEFGQGGHINIDTLGLNFGVQFLAGPTVTLSADGSLFVGVHRNETEIGLIIKLSCNGALDKTFQNNGTLVVKNDGRTTYLTGLTHDGQGGLFAFGSTSLDTELFGVLMKYDSAGVKIKEFGKGGTIELVEPKYQPVIMNVQVLDDSRLVATGYAYTSRDGKPALESLITVLTWLGNPDKSFNSGKVGYYQFSNDSDSDQWLTAVQQLQSGGKIVAVGIGGSETSTGPVIGRFNADGSLDKTLVDGSPYGTLQDASFFASSGLALNTTPTQILVVGSVNSRPAVLAIKI